MTKREQGLLKKIEELEARIRALESRPGGETHNHYHYETPRYAPLPTYPTWPYQPWWTQPVSVPSVGDFPNQQTVTTSSHGASPGYRTVYGVNVSFDANGEVVFAPADPTVPAEQDYSDSCRFGSIGSGACG